MRCENSGAPRTFHLWPVRLLAGGGGAAYRRVCDAASSGGAALRLLCSAGSVCRRPALSCGTLTDRRWRGCAAPRPTPVPPRGGTPEVTRRSSALPSARAARHGLPSFQASAAPSSRTARCSPPPHPWGGATTAAALAAEATVGRGCSGARVARAAVLGGVGGRRHAASLSAQPPLISNRSNRLIRMGDGGQLTWVGEPLPRHSFTPATAAARRSRAQSTGSRSARARAQPG